MPPPLPRYGMDGDDEDEEEELRVGGSSSRQTTHQGSSLASTSFNRQLQQQQRYSTSEASASQSVERSYSYSRNRQAQDDTNDTSYSLERDRSTKVLGVDAQQRRQYSETLDPDLDSILHNPYPLSNHLRSSKASYLDSHMDSGMEPEEEGLESLTPFEQLTLFLSTQKAAPEILPFPSQPFNLLINQMEQQQSILDSLLHTNHDNHITNNSNSNNNNLDSNMMDVDVGASTSSNKGAMVVVDEDEVLRLNLVSVDLERCKWLLKKILRFRLELVQKYCFHIFANPDQEMVKLSAEEQRFVTSFVGLKREVFGNAVLNFLPDQLASLDDDNSSGGKEGGNGGMVQSPDLNTPVFVRCLTSCGTLTLPDNETAKLEKDSIHFLRYSSVRHLVAQAKVVLV